MSNIHLIVSVTWRVVEYERRVVRGDEAFKLRDAVKEIVFQQPASSFVSYANRRNGARLQNGVSNSPPPSDLLT